MNFLILVGIDIIEIDRIKRAVERNPRFKQRLYTDGELAYCAGKGNPYPSLAARFAAKEAFRKLYPQLASRIRFKDVEIAIGPEGKPELILHGQALENARQANLKEVDVSLSHSRVNAIAVVIARSG